MLYYVWDEVEEEYFEVDDEWLKGVAKIKKATEFNYDGNDGLIVVYNNKIVSYEREQGVWKFIMTLK